MIYVKTVTTPANTSQAGFLVSRLPVLAGVVYKLEIEFPQGHKGLHRCQIYHNSRQTWPHTPEEYFNSDGYTISFDDTYQLKAEPLEFIIVTWNLSDTYSHKLQVRIGLVSEDIYIGRYLPSVAYEQAVKILNDMYRQQEEQRQKILEQGFTFINTE